MNQDYEHIKDIFEKLLGAKVNLNSNIKLGEKDNFITLITTLQSSADVEYDLYSVGGIDLARVTSPLWDVVELYLDVVYGREVTDLITWYLFDRVDIDGESEPLGENEDGTPFYINTIEELWEYVINQIKDKDGPPGE